MLHSNLVYKFKRNICNDIYYGKTKHHLNVKAYEDRYQSLNYEEGKKPKRKAVFDHAFHTIHNASSQDFETVAKEPNEFRFRELLLIMRDDPPLNRHVKSIPLELLS